jgi:hypothetical protein
MKEAAAALARARPGLAVYDRRRKVEWALRLQQRWLRCAALASFAGCLGSLMLLMIEVSSAVAMLHAPI